MNEKQKEQLSKVIETLRKRGAETFEEMILLQAAVITRQDKELKDAQQRLEMAKENAIEYMGEAEDLRMEMARKAESTSGQFKQIPTITFNGDVHFGHAEIYYRKDGDEHNNSQM